MRFLSRVYEVDAIQFDGDFDNFVEINKFCNGQFHLVGNDDVDARVYDSIHKVWIGVMKGQWIVKDPIGGFHIYNDTVFAKKYRAVE